jgi:micrococcal nuclease
VYRRVFLLIALLLVAGIEFWSMRSQSLLRQEPVEVPQEATSAAVSRDDEYVVVSHVLDGDTMVLVDGRRVRLIGIDAPEVSHEGKKEECFSKESKDATARLVGAKKVRLVKDTSDTDSYGRLLRYVYVGDVFVNEVLVQQGYARAWRFPPDEAQSTMLMNAQSQAKQQNHGIWQLCAGR